VIDWTTRPIGIYPVPETRPSDRRNSPFRTSANAAMNLLERELAKLGARSAVLEIDVNTWDLRLDGRLRANARPQGPRVVVSAETKHGPMQWPCDTFRHYEANIYAIALTLEKLRAIDRYGVTTHGEQYTGWIAIPGATGATDPVESAWELLVMTAAGEHASALPQHARTRQSALQHFREAAKFAHPDAGGTTERFDAIVRARDTILNSLDTNGAGR
jgi:hypothetical protein